MASSTTRSFNRTMLDQFKKDLDSDGVEYFIGIAKNTPFFFNITASILNLSIINPRCVILYSLLKRYHPILSLFL